MKTRAAIIAAAIAVSGLALSPGAISAPIQDLPAMHKEGQISYLTGGVSREEANAIKHAAKYYPLELEFLLKAKPQDEHLSDIKVRIKDGHDRMVLSVAANGPFLLARMPVGKYTVSAERNGKIEHRQIEIAAKEHRRVVFEWRS